MHDTCLNRCAPLARKSADHGVWQLLPIASPMGCRHPNPAYRRFGHPTRLGQEILYNWHIVNVLHNTITTVYTAPSSIVPSIVSFSIPITPIMSSIVVVIVSRRAVAPHVAIIVVVIIVAHHAPTIIFDRHHRRRRCLSPIAVIM